MTGVFRMPSAALVLSILWRTTFRCRKKCQKVQVKGLGLKGVNTLCRFGHGGKVESEPVRVGQKSEQPPCTHVCWRCSTFEHLRLKPQTGWTRMNIWYFNILYMKHIEHYAIIWTNIFIRYVLQSFCFKKQYLCYVCVCLHACCFFTLHIQIVCFEHMIKRRDAGHSEGLGHLLGCGRRGMEPMALVIA